MIDGGFSKAYHSETGIAGYTLIYNSHGLQLVQHEPFESAVKAVEEGKDIISTKVIVEATTDRITVRDSTIGKELQVQIDDLKNLLAAYRFTSPEVNQTPEWIAARSTPWTERLRSRFRSSRRFVRKLI